MASWFLHMPPAPLNVSRPDEAERPAPHSARIRVDDARTLWNSGMEVLAFLVLWIGCLSSKEDILKVSFEKGFGG